MKTTKIPNSYTKDIVNGYVYVGKKIIIFEIIYGI